jgi:hypothetical protein
MLHPSVQQRGGVGVDSGPGVTELPSTPKIKQQSSITNPHSETGHFHIKSMPKCGKFGAASTAGWGAGAAIFSPVRRVNVGTFRHSWKPKPNQTFKV